MKQSYSQNWKQTSSHLTIATRFGEKLLLIVQKVLKIK